MNLSEPPGDVELIPEADNLYTSTDQALSSPEAKSAIELPGKVLICENYPNPFNPTTAIKYTLPEACKVKIDIYYNLLGQEIETLLNENQQPGFHEIVWNAGNNPTGAYFYHIEAGARSLTKKMLFLK